MQIKTTKRHAPGPLVPRICEECAETFLVEPRSVRRGGGRFCTKDCYRVWSNPLNRFWSKVICDVATGCWLWTASLRGGYGQFYDGTRLTKAVRFCWELFNPPIPKGLRICHNCPAGDNPQCVRPDHMFLGTARDNSRDMANKGRAATPRAKIPPADVLAIRAAHATGIRQNALAQQYGVAKATINRIVHGKAWRHVT